MSKHPRSIYFETNRKNIAGWWNFRKSGTIPVSGIFPDYSGWGVNGLLNGNAFVDSTGLNLASSGDYVSFGTGKFENGTVGSIIGWIDASVGVDGERNIFSYTTNSKKFIFQVYNGKLMVQFYASPTNDYVITNGSIFVKHHVAVTCNGSTWMIYIDGQLQTFSTGTNTGKWLSDMPSDVYSSYIGKDDIDVSTPAGVKSLIIFDRVLSGQEIARDYAETKAFYPNPMYVLCSGSDSSYTNGAYLPGTTYDYEKLNDWMETDYIVYNAGTWEIWAMPDFPPAIKMWTSTNGDADNIPTTGWTAVSGTGYIVPPTVEIK